MSTEPPKRKFPRGTLVELVRLILVGLFTAGGWQLSQQLGATGTNLLLGVVLGSLVGYVLGGVLGRQTAVAMSAVEREFARMPPSELLAGSLGLIVGLVIAVRVASAFCLTCSGPLPGDQYALWPCHGHHNRFRRIAGA